MMAGVQVLSLLPIVPPGVMLTPFLSFYNHPLNPGPPYLFLSVLILFNE